MNGQFRKLDCIFLTFCSIVVIFLAGSVGKRGQELNKRMICSSNLKQLITGMTNYAYGHNGRFPDGGGYWPWDVARTTSNSILQYMGINVSGQNVPIQDVFYCPANYSQQVLRTTYWNFSSGYRAAGYSFLWYAMWNSNGTRPIYAAMNRADIPALTDPSKKWIKDIYVEQPSQREFVIDSVLCSFSSSVAPAETYPYGNFGKVPEGAIGSDMSNHLKTAAEPYGGNIGFVDGHVQWRPWSEMKMRWGGWPYWWW